MFRKLKEELSQKNYELYEKLRDMNYEFPGGRSLEEEFLQIEEYSQNILKEKFRGRENESSNKSSSYYFITVNLGKDKDQMKELYEKSLEAMHRYKWLRKSIINYEYHTEKGGHCHSHMVVDTTKRRDSIINLLSNFYKIDKNYIDIKRYYNDPINHLNYVRYIKKDKSKESYMQLDENLRNEYNIPPYTDNWVGTSKE